MSRWYNGMCWVRSLYCHKRIWCSDEPRPGAGVCGVLAFVRAPVGACGSAGLECIHLYQHSTNTQLKKCSRSLGEKIAWQRTLPADAGVHGLSGTLQHLSGCHETWGKAATPQCAAHKGRLLGLGLAASSSAATLASFFVWASSCLSSCIRSICRP